MNRALPLVAFAACLAACGADRDFREADFLEKAKRYPAAVDAFERFAARHPGDPRAAEALVRAGRLYVEVFDRCREAKPLYERAAREYEGHEPWAGFARRRLLDCPEYFPLRKGSRWVYVDSETGGQNMKLDLRVDASTDGARGRVDGAYFAGAERVRPYARSYVKEDWAVWEVEGADRVPILKYPFAPGMAWKARRGGREVEFRIESDRAVVRFPGAAYRDCLKVREAETGAQAWKYDYYAPGVGRVKTTVGAPGSESPNTELKTVEIGTVLGRKS